MKRSLLFLTTLLGMLITTTGSAATLMEVYQQALVSDQIFQQAISQQLVTRQGLPISISAVLPTLAATVNPYITKTNVEGVTNFVGSNTVKGYTFNLALTQTVFNFAQFANISQNCSLSKQADATVNAALQSLMIRVAKAYFAILQDEDTLRNVIATKEAYAKQLDQVTQQYNVGLKTITDVYTAQASYDSSVAGLITAKNNLSNDRENLRVITGVYYPSIAKLSEKFPLITPRPSNIELWVTTAQQQNWAIRAAQYAADAARTNIKQQFAGHLPTLQLQSNYEIQFTKTIADQPDTSAVPVNGNNRNTSYGGGLLLNIPIVQGGFVVASTRQAQYQYRLATQQLDQQVRNTINTTRQSYLGVVAGISQIEADRQAIKSFISSLEGMQAGYQVGTQTLVDVLNQQQKVFQSQQQYAQDRYLYVNNLLALKAAAGTLSQRDLEAINSWLIEENANDEYVNNYEAKPVKPTHPKVKKCATAHVKKKSIYEAKKQTEKASSKVSGHLI